MVDNTPSGIGRVESFDMILVPSPTRTISSARWSAQQFVYYFIDVPADATNLTADPVVDHAQCSRWIFTFAWAICQISRIY